MTPLAVSLVLLSACTHLYWNAQVKRSPAPGLFTWWVQVLGALWCVVPAAWLAWPLQVPAVGWLCVVGAGLFNGVYFTLIATAYDADDLSRCYPIARGVAPVATAAWGVLLLHEHPSLVGAVGIGTVVAGLAVLAAGSGGHVSRLGVLAAIGTGLCSSAYSTIDKRGVALVPVLLYLVLTYLAGAITQTPFLLRRSRPADFAWELRRAGLPLWISGAFAAWGYVLVLWVLKTAPVSYVVPVRSIGVPLSVLIGAAFLGENPGRARALAALLIAAGISVIAMAR